MNAHDEITDVQLEVLREELQQRRMWDLEDLCRVALYDGPGSDPIARADARRRCAGLLDGPGKAWVGNNPQPSSVGADE